MIGAVRGAEKALRQVFVAKFMGEATEAQRQAFDERQRITSTPEMAESYLRGMFAFALWDARRRRLLVARDRFGKKPVYYAALPQGLYFASELKCLRAARVPLDIDREALRRAAVENLLLAAHALGIRNLLVMMGDPPSVGDYPEAGDQHDIVPSGLVKLIKGSLNSGKDSAGISIGAGTSFHVGVAVNFYPQDLEREIKTFRKKIVSGADFAVSQPIFDVEPSICEHMLITRIPLGYSYSTVKWSQILPNSGPVRDLLAKQPSPLASFAAELLSRILPLLMIMVVMTAIALVIVLPPAIVFSFFVARYPKTDAENQRAVSAKYNVIDNI